MRACSSTCRDKVNNAAADVMRRKMTASSPHWSTSVSARGRDMEVKLNVGLGLRHHCT